MQSLPIVEAVSSQLLAVFCGKNGTKQFFRFTRPVLKSFEFLGWKASPPKGKMWNSRPRLFKNLSATGTTFHDLRVCQRLMNNYSEKYGARRPP
jgi:hypothetical protein